jgi:hypothetical protein
LTTEKIISHRTGKHSVRNELSRTGGVKAGAVPESTQEGAASLTDENVGGADRAVDNSLPSQPVTSSTFREVYRSIICRGVGGGGTGWGRHLGILRLSV